ncbi:MAG: STAS domain-containing protein [Phycisphaerae bacterium]|nr:STAS domain-containing protein [Phycisphaerae bacterium]
MAVELYSEDIVVVATAEGPSPFKIWLRAEESGDLTGDLRWLRDESPDYHVIVDLAQMKSIGSESYKALVDLRERTEEDDYRFVLCGLSSHLKRELKCMGPTCQFDAFDTREAAIAALSPRRELLLERGLSAQAGVVATPKV